MLPELLSHTSNGFCLTATTILKIHFLSCKTDLVLQSSCGISAIERHAVDHNFREFFSKYSSTSLRACMPNSRCFLVRILRTFNTAREFGAGIFPTNRSSTF